jgi:hypothetical protein
MISSMIRLNEAADFFVVEEARHLPALPPWPGLDVHAREAASGRS